MDEVSQALVDGFLMTASQKRSIRKAFLEVHFDQLGMAGLSMKQLKKFIMKPHRTMGCIPYWALLLHIGEEASPFLCVTWRQLPPLPPWCTVVLTHACTVAHTHTLQVPGV